MPERFAAARDILSHDYVNHAMLKRIRECGERYPCNSKYCSKCFNQPIDPNVWRIDPQQFISDKVVNPVYYPHYVGRGAYRHLKSIQGILSPFYGLPVQEIAPTTVKFCYLAGGEDIESVKQFYQHGMRDVGRAVRDIVHPDVKMVYQFEWSWTTAGQANLDLPLRAPGVSDVSDMDPNQVVAFLHAHGLVHFPGYHYSKVGDVFRHVFDGRWQVHVATPQIDRAVAEFSGGHFEIKTDQFDTERSSIESKKLADHPSDRLPPDWYDQSRSPFVHSIAELDAIIDAQADRYDQLHGIGEDAASPEDIERMSGLIRWAHYMAKEHIPKAHSRYEQLAKGAASEAQAKCECSEFKLTPEQMVVAIHGDAEIKRKLHGQRLIQKFGTQKRSKPKVSQAFNCASGQSVTETGEADQKYRKVSEVELTDNHHCPTNVTSKRKLGLQRHEIPSLKFIIYKEACTTAEPKPLFCCLRGGSKMKLCLGVRLLRPP